MTSLQAHLWQRLKLYIYKTKPKQWSCQKVMPICTTTCSKAIYKSSSRPTGTTWFWWDSKICFTVPVTTTYDLSHPERIDVIKCQCKAKEKKCITDACGCWKDHISCTPYCTCAWEEGCHKPYTNHLLGVIAEGVTNINDSDYYADLDIKIRYKLSF